VTAVVGAGGSPWFIVGGVAIVGIAGSPPAVIRGWLKKTGEGPTGKANGVNGEKAPKGMMVGRAYRYGFRRGRFMGAPIPGRKPNCPKAAGATITDAAANPIIDAIFVCFILKSPSWLRNGRSIIQCDLTV